MNKLFSFEEINTVKIETVTTCNELSLEHLNKRENAIRQTYKTTSTNPFVESIILRENI